MADLKKNYFYQSTYQVITALLPILTAPYIARVLGADGVGTYSYTFSIVSYFILFAKLGIQNYGNREIAKVRDDKKMLNRTFSEITTVHGITSVMSILTYLIYIFECAPQYRIVATVQTIYLFGELFDVNWLFYGLEQIEVTVIRNCVIKALTVAAIFTFVRKPDDVVTYCAIMAISAMLSEMIIWVRVPRNVKFIKVTWKEYRRHFGPLLRFFIPSIAISLYKIMDKVMLGGIAGTVQAGYYENADKICNILIGFIYALGIVMMPRMANMAAKGEYQKSRDIIGTSVKAIMILVSGMSFGLAAVAFMLAPVFFGEEFSACGVLIASLSSSMPFIAFANVLRTQYLIPNQKDSCFQISVVSGAAINLVINACLIPSMGALGAVIGTIVAEVTVCVIQAVYCFRFLPMKDYLITCLRYLSIGLCMFGIVRWVSTMLTISIGALLFLIIIGMAVYSGGVILSLYLHRDKLL